ncbi:hypothetical protein JIG36_32320 [Actinoplanes sp. LDG1-06]|uniref:Uncharacterized protein n=1 Tax=Paractinoplanes ovalisporus TaxID=2810368 RepID=A0ABS2ALW2_9ACTN|nr:hypothetical protein [Actinoplanes ovalisporus]MBM2620211.1 hypothetical protein [Actinoplanes ovalisporus]
MNWDAVEAVASAAGATVTFAALVVTWGALRREARARRADVARLDRQRQQDEAAEAGLVMFGDPEGVLNSGQATLKLTNFGNRPVFDVRVRLVRDGRPIVLTDGRDSDIPRTVVLEPQKSRKITINAPYGEEPFVAGRVEFRDSSGRLWRRSNNGPPRRLDADGNELEAGGREP